MHTKIMAALVCAASLASGCAYNTAAFSNKGRAYVVKATPFGGTFWNCDATKGDPVCYQVKQIRNEAK